MKYNIEITEILQRTISVEAEGVLDALNNVYERYLSNEIILGAEDYIDTKFDFVSEKQ